MPTYVVRWSEGSAYEKVDEYEWDQFSVGDDPDPLGEWIVWYLHKYRGGKIPYWVKSPPQTRQSEIVNRDLPCVAGEVELLYMRRVGESRLAQLSRLAMQIERSRAILANRPVRRFEGLSELR